MNRPPNYLLLFADLVGSTEVAVEAHPAFYSATYVASFHWAATCAHQFMKVDAFPEAKFSIVLATPRIAGDEVLSFTPLPDTATEQEDLIGSAVAFAFATKLFWLVSPYNMQRIQNRQFPRDLAVGIHVGPAATVPPEPDSEETRQIASLHINIAKRIETIARKGKESRIFGSYEVMDLYRRWLVRMNGVARKGRFPILYTHFVMRRNPQLVKGIPKPLQLFELEWRENDDELVEYLLEQLHQTPKSVEVQLEAAAKQAMEIFLPPKREPVFASEDGKRRVYGLCETASQHIAAWFDGMQSASQLFFDEYWLVLTSYLACCGMLRHPEVTEADRDKYAAVARVVYDRLKALAKERHEKRNKQ